MKDGSDPFETLRRINPVDPSTLPDPERSREALDAMERIMRGDAAGAGAERFRRTRSLWRTRRRRVYLIPIVAAAALAVATLAWALTRGPRGISTSPATRQSTCTAEPPSCPRPRRRRSSPARALAHRRLREATSATRGLRTAIGSCRGVPQP